ncbi:hypothetical protein [Paludisphaera borealis]|uniref:Uncharacterized protein n=1 Tax=Paludisphaera borealis TaxID=1387353 RepID=A0A1U7CRY3_9BACT|nr:hypothetical protein [Paludisphaera borealis]APW61692.1 hypothetical protein BSF38_03219 [Paludisphaera borealis]
MKRLSSLLVCFVLVEMGGPAAACMNDNESPTHEREFRSQYGGLAWIPSGDEVAYHYRNRHNLLIAGGAALLGGGFVLAARQVRVRA